MISNGNKLAFGFKEPHFKSWWGYKIFLSFLSCALIIEPSIWARRRVLLILWSREPFKKKHYKIIFSYYHYIIVIIPGQILRLTLKLIVVLVKCVL